MLQDIFNQKTRLPLWISGLIRVIHPYPYPIGAFLGVFAVVAKKLRRYIYHTTEYRRYD